MSESVPVEWTSRRVSLAPHSERGVTVYELDSGNPGPHLLVLGGIHGDEVGGIVAVGRIATTLWPLVAGRLSVVPIAHEASHEANTRISPIDGQNLARIFPGAVGGTATEEIAWLITHRLIAHADVLIDLHTSNAATDMPLFVGCIDDGSTHATRAVELALGFGLDLIWTHPDPGPGRTLTAAIERGIPALYVESPLGGILDETYVQAYIDGVVSVMENLGMVPDATRRPEPALWLHGNGNVDTFSAAAVAGLFVRSVSLMDHVRRGQQVGRILNSLGQVITDVSAPADGYVTTLQRAAVVAEGQPLLGVSHVRPPGLGLPSDNFTSLSRRMQ